MSHIQPLQLIVVLDMLISVYHAEAEFSMIRSPIHLIAR